MLRDIGCLRKFAQMRINLGAHKFMYFLCAFMWICLRKLL
jgi:hypothetical protein